MERAPRIAMVTSVSKQLVACGSEEYLCGVEPNALPGAGDDGLDRPQVTPAPAPSDDQLFRLVGVGTVATAIAALVLLRWFRRHVVISWRK